MGRAWLAGWLLLGASAANAGPLDPSALDDAMAAAGAAVRQCHADAMKRNSRIAGEVVVQATVGPKGGITEASIWRSTITNKALLTCILGVVEAQTVARPGGGGFTPMRRAFLLWDPPAGAAPITMRQAQRLVRRGARRMNRCPRPLPDRLELDLLVARGEAHPVTGDTPDEWARCAYRGFRGRRAPGVGVVHTTIRFGPDGKAIIDEVAVVGPP